MAGSVNRVTLLGNVGKDPEICTTQSGSKIANLSLATSERWKDKQSGEMKEKTEWHKIACFNEKTTEVIEKYVHKGSKIYVEGALQTRKWTDQHGNERYSIEVVIAAFRGELVLVGNDKGGDGLDGGEQQRSPSRQDWAQHTRQGASRDQGWGVGIGADLDDSIPF